ncbi:hypothetical protein MIND_00760200 [Mycena indigotica]|uniref:Uncharacterized protein n=1 Tax=Mycena indigotica TaxID=2126181 RepID=A0A8H6SM52_9AGAR|nr:uncharacterized protein MIND_00760200 [Mycena indigotica]KAF7301941.1 hypothetical protein MIND_00760200 [Mycena indigotica]
MSLFPSGAGPTLALPEFKSIAIKGPYHASAPIYLALSVAEKYPDTRIVMITPSRDALSAALQEHKDSWMIENAGNGSVLEFADCTVVYYPPTPAHFSYLVSSLSTNVEGSDPKAILYRPPSLMVLIELSAYFMLDVEADPDHHQWTLSSYLTLVARSLAAVAVLSSSADVRKHPSELSLALFDSNLDNLRLPVLKQPLADLGRSPSTVRKEVVARYVQKYFELFAVVEEDDDVNLTPSQEADAEIQEAGRQRWNRMRIYGQGDVLLSCLKWLEARDPQTDGVVFSWN